MKERKARLVKGDREYVRRLTRKNRVPSTRLENLVEEISLVHGIANLYEERLASPQVFVPVREYNQKNDDTPLPPENLQSDMRNLSQRAKQAWELWTGNSEEDGSETVEIEGKTYSRLKPEQIEALLLDNDEKEQLSKYREDVKLHDEEWKEDELRKIYGITSTVPKFLNCQAGVIKRDNHSRTYADHLELVVKSDYETNKMRKSALKDQEHLVPNCTFQDDPDYIPPISGSRNFNTAPPANRIFDAVFKIYTSANQYTILGPSTGKGVKDYTDVTDVEYMCELKGIKPVKITVEYCKFEIDLRVTIGNAPDPKNYKKVNPQSNSGLKLMKLLNDQPNLWKEFCWTYIDDSGSSRKKVAYGITFSIDSDNKATYWVYLDEKSIKNGNSIIYNRKPMPIIRYGHIKDRTGNKIEIKATLTYHNSKKFLKVNPGYLEENPDASQYVLENLEAKLKKDGYTFVKEEEDMFGLVSQLWLRNNALNKKARDKFILSETDWNKKYGSS